MLEKHGNFIPKPASKGTNRIGKVARTTIYDLRGQGNQFNIDVNGFEIMSYDGTVRDLFEDNSHEQTYLHEKVANTIKNRFGASCVIIFNHIIRAREPLRPADQCDDTHKNPIFYPHVDFDPTGAKAKLQEVLEEEEATKVLKNRFQIMNVWKPLGPNSVTNRPLSICNYQTLDLKNDVHLSETRGSNGSTSGYAISMIIRSGTIFGT